MGYSYLPVMGVEPFSNVAKAPLTTLDTTGSADVTTFGGGAEITGDNLLITLWGNLVLAQNPTDPPLSGQLLQPDYAAIEGGAVRDVFPGILNKGFSPFAKSRTSFKLGFVSTPGQDSPPFVTLPLMGIMNPPGELKNAYMYAAKAAKAAISTNNPFGVLVQFKKSILDFLMWRAAFALGTFPQQTGQQGVFSAGGLFLLPLAKTSGADGVFPEFYPPAIALVALGDADAINAYFDNIAAGNFYVPAFFSPAVDPQGNFWNVEISWPGSAVTR